MCVCSLFLLALTLPAAPASADSRTQCSLHVCATAVATAEAQENNNAPDGVALGCAYAGSGSLPLAEGTAQGTVESPGGLSECNTSCSWEGQGQCGDEDADTLFWTKCDGFVSMETAASQGEDSATSTAFESAATDPQCTGTATDLLDDPIELIPGPGDPGDPGPGGCYDPPLQDTRELIKKALDRVPEQPPPQVQDKLCIPSPG